MHCTRAHASQGGCGCAATHIWRQMRSGGHGHTRRPKFTAGRRIAWTDLMLAPLTRCASGASVSQRQFVTHPRRGPPLASPPGDGEGEGASARPPPAGMWCRPVLEGAEALQDCSRPAATAVLPMPRCCRLAEPPRPLPALPVAANASLRSMKSGRERPCKLIKQQRHNCTSCRPGWQVRRRTPGRPLPRPPAAATRTPGHDLGARA